MMAKTNTLASIFFAVILTITGCTKPSDDISLVGDKPGSASPTRGAFSTNCGTVINGSLENPASAADGFQGSISVLGPNLLSITLPTGPLLVKLHGLSAPSNNGKASAARRALEGITSGQEGIFIPADQECTASLSGGGQGALGQVFTLSGDSYSEMLIEKGLSQVSSDPCGGNLLNSCYRALEEETGSKIAGEIGRLLWKPESDSDGKLAVHTAPFGSSVKVSGEEGLNRGSGNGFGSLARFSKSGCGYGNNVKVEVFNAQGAAYTFNGATSITIPGGCSRYCYDGGSLSQCAK